MPDPLSVGTGDRVTFPDALLMAGEVAAPPGGEHWRVVASAPRQARHPRAARHEPRADVTSRDHYSPLRERMICLRGSRLLLLGIVLAPLVMAGFVVLTLFLFLPLLGLRWMFRGPSMPAVVRRDGDAPCDADVANLFDASSTRRA
jgi:hypothetical protein